MTTNTRFDLVSVEFDPESFLWRGGFMIRAESLGTTELRVFTRDTKNARNIQDVSPSLTHEEASARLREKAKGALEDLLKTAASWK